MTMIRLRATGPRTGFDALLADLHGMEGWYRYPDWGHDG